MMWAYQCLDFFATITDVICLYVISRLLLKECRYTFTFCKYIPPIAMFIATWVFTWFSELAAFKIPTLFVITVVVLKICYKDTIYQSIVAGELWFAQDVICAEAMGFIILKYLFGDDLQILVDGHRVPRWEVYIILMITRIVVLSFAYIILKNFKYIVKANDCIILSAVFIIGFTVMMFNSYNVMNLAKTPDFIMFVSASGLSVVFFSVFCIQRTNCTFKSRNRKTRCRLHNFSSNLPTIGKNSKTRKKYVPFTMI